MRKIYLIRHGRPYFTDERRYCIGNKTDLPLSDEGKAEAARLKNFLQNKNIEKFYTSPLKRCRQMMEIIAPPSSLIITVEGLKEIDMGIWDGMAFGDIKKLYPRQYLERGENIAGYTVTEGESFEQCLRRAWVAWQHIVTATNSNIAIVAHAGVNRTLLCKLMDKPLIELLDIRQPFGCVNIIEQVGDSFKIEKIGFIPHCQD
ncbi:MAG: histidine phosphatase family protein [Bacillota bacterium]|jgi:alpha-ribazole phosphatase